MKADDKTPSGYTLHRSFAWSMFGLAALFYAYEFLLRIIPSVMVPELMVQYSVNATQIGLIDASYYWAYTPLQLLVGPILDQYGVRKPIVIAALLCAIGSFLFALGLQFDLVLVGRFLVGSGSAFAFVATLKLASEWLPDRYFALTSGIATMLGMLGAIGGELALTHMILIIGNRSTLTIATVLAIALGITLWLFIQDKKATLARKRPVTTLLSHLRHTLNKPYIWINGCIGMLLYLSIIIFSQLWGIPYFEQVFHLPPEQSVMLATVPLWGWALGGPLVGYLSQRVKSTRLLLRLGSTSAAGLFLIFLFILNQDHIAPIHALILFAFGLCSSVQILVFEQAKVACKPEDTATTIAVTNMIVMLSGLINPVVGIILENSGAISSTNPPVYSRYAYDNAFLLIPLALVLAGLLSSILRLFKPQPQEES